MSTTRTTARTYWVAIRAMLLFTLVLGVGYTAGVGCKANGCWVCVSPNAGGKGKGNIW